MAKRKKRAARHHDAACPGCRSARQTTPTAGLPPAIPLAIPLHWSPEEALAVYELINDLRELIWAIYQRDIQTAIRRQRQSGPIDPLYIDEADLPF